MMEVKRHDMGNAFAIRGEEVNDNEEAYPPPAYIAEARRRLARASILWRRGGKYREQIIRMKCLGNYVRSVRKDLDLTRTELAERVNLNPYFLLLIEGGLVSLVELEPVIGQLAQGLGKTPSELYRAFECIDKHENLDDDQEGKFGVKTERRERT
jgi:DNA-binding XRE family transcriptional regulator